MSRAPTIGVSMIAQIFQSVACNAAHSIQQRTAKWLIAAVDRTGGPEIPLTQDQLAVILAVGRSYISRVLRSFKEREILRIQRGRLVIRNVEELRGMACECNGCVRDHFERVLSGVYPTDEERIAA